MERRNSLHQRTHGYQATQWFRYESTLSTK